MYGSYANFDTLSLSKCMDFVLPMGYCNPQSATIAGPTIELDALRHDFIRHQDNKSNPGKRIWPMPPALPGGPPAMNTTTEALETLPKAIQLSVSPVFLLTGIGAMMNVLSGRLSRSVDHA